MQSIIWGQLVNSRMFDISRSHDYAIHDIFKNNFLLRRKESGDSDFFESPIFPSVMFKIFFSSDVIQVKKI